MSSSTAGGAGSNDSNAARRQSKRPKCNYSLMGCHLFFLAFWFDFGGFSCVCRLSFWIFFFYRGGLMVLLRLFSQRRMEFFS